MGEVTRSQHGPQSPLWDICAFLSWRSLGVCALRGVREASADVSGYSPLFILTYHKSSFPVEMRVGKLEWGRSVPSSGSLKAAFEMAFLLPRRGGPCRTPGVSLWETGWDRDRVSLPCRHRPRIRACGLMLSILFPLPVPALVLGAPPPVPLTPQ